MALQIQKSVFGTAQNAANGRREDLPKAKYWVNFGYTVQMQNDEGAIEDRFVSGCGVGLDTIKPRATNSSNEGYALFNQACNDLHEQFMAEARTLKPGETRIISTDPVTGLQVQLRHVQEERTMPVEGNPFRRVIAFGSAEKAA